MGINMWLVIFTLLLAMRIAAVICGAFRLIVLHLALFIILRRYNHSVK